MEAHHHTAAEHNKIKLLKEYLLEALMIFIAVFMSFAAENLREHLLDNEREYGYVEGLVKNFETDTITLTEIIKLNKIQVKGLDSLSKVTKDNISNLPVQDSLYKLSKRYLFYTYNFHNNDITLSQLRNTGGYRTIRKKDVVDSIAVFEAAIGSINEQYKATYSIFKRARERAIQTLDMTIGAKFKKAPTSTPVLITQNKGDITAYFNSCWMAGIALNGYNQMLEGQLVYTRQLIADLKKEYQLK